MTQVDIVFPYVRTPTEQNLRSLNSVREVYGIRRIRLDEKSRTIRVEYDATRLDVATVRTLLRGSGLDVGEKLSLANRPTPAPA